MPEYQTLTLVPDAVPVLLTARTTEKNSKRFFANGAPKREDFGMKIARQSDELPTEVYFEGQVVNLTKGLTGYSAKGEELSTDHRAKVSATAVPVQFTDDDGAVEIRNLKVSISETKDGAWNVVAILTRQGGAARPVESAEDIYERVTGRKFVA